MASEGKTAEACWCQIMAAFWSGKFSLYSFAHPKNSVTPGRDLVALPPQEEVAKGLLGQERTIDVSALNELSGWTLNEYRKDHLFHDYTARHARFGLAARRADFDRWYSGPREALHHRKRTAGAKATKRQAVTEFIKEKHGGEIPAGVTYKMIVKDLRAGGGPQVSERTVSRALGRK
jgi:hypothetical protein